MTADDFRAARKAMGHTQHTLAVALRMGKHGWQTISGWENGSTPIPGPVALAMEHLAHCPPIQGVAQNATRVERSGGENG